MRKLLVYVMVGALVVGSVTSNASAKSKVSLNKKSVSLKVGQKIKLKLKGAKAGKVKWSVKSKSIASVTKKGVVKAKKKGSTRITAKYKGKKYFCRVVVKSKSSYSTDWATVKSAYEKLAEYISEKGVEGDDYLKIVSEDVSDDGKVTLEVTYESDQDSFVFKKITEIDSEITDEVSMYISLEDIENASVECAFTQNDILFTGTTEVEISTHSDEDDMLGFEFDNESTDAELSDSSSEDSDSESDEEGEEDDSDSTDELDLMATDNFNIALLDWNEFLSGSEVGLTMSDLGFSSYNFE